MDKDHLDWLADQFASYARMYAWDVQLEHCAVFTDLDIYVVPNRHEDPYNHCRIWKSDVRSQVRNQLIGFMHTHPPDSEPGPSDEDYDLLPDGQIGAVWQRGTRRVDFYDNETIIYTCRLPRGIT